MPLNTNDRANLSLQKLLDAPAPNLRYQGARGRFLNGLTHLRGPLWVRVMPFGRFGGSAPNSAIDRTTHCPKGDLS